jgi:indolepyruvate ferredoxin oxidoreductase alpha subunit
MSSTSGQSKTAISNVVSGSQSLAYGALEAGVHLVTSYPGSPATDTVEAIQRLGGQQAQVRWTINEKSAADAALGCSLTGKRALLCVKAPGFNVALDSLMVANLAPGDGGFVILAGDDPSGWASQNEEDTRPLVQALEIPLLEPASVPDAREVMRYAFSLSEEMCIPVVVRITRALTLDKAEISALQMLASIEQPKEFRRQPDRWTVLPIHVVDLHQRLQAKMKVIQEVFGKSSLNQEKGKGNQGIIAAGYAYQKLNKILQDEVSASLNVLQLTTLSPLPENRIATFLHGLESVLVIEELAPHIETQVQALAQRRRLTLPIYGRLSGHLPGAGELFDDALVNALSRFAPGREWPEYPSVERTMPSRASLCDGCPYIPAFNHLLGVLERNGGRDNYVITGETGCLVRAQLPPWEILDMKYSMGSSIGIATGLAQAGVTQKLIALSGDSAFLHNGLGELIDAVQTGVDLLVVLLDNNKTAMTGGQPHPATRNENHKSKPVDLEALVRAAGVNQLRIVDPEDALSTRSAYEEGIRSAGVSVVIIDKPCPMYAD